MKKPALIYAILGSATAVLTVALIVVSMQKGSMAEKTEVEVKDNESSVILEAEQAKKDEEIQKLKTQIEKKTSEMLEKEQTIEKMQIEIDDLEKQIANIDNSGKNTLAQKQELEDEKAILIQKKKKLEDEKTALENSNATLRSDINTLNTEISDLNAAIETMQNTFLVIYVDDSGVVYQESVAKNNNVANVPTPTARTGYDVEWSSDGQNITKDTVIAAEYTAKTYNITYILGRPINAGSEHCGAVQYDENNEIVLGSTRYVFDDDNSRFYQKNNPAKFYPVIRSNGGIEIVTISGVTYTLIREHRLLYSVIGTNGVAATAAFANLPKTIKYGETLEFPYKSTSYVNPLKDDGTVGTGDMDGSTAGDTWAIFGADSLSYDAMSVENATTIYIRATQDILVFVYYAPPSM